MSDTKCPKCGSSASPPPEPIVAASWVDFACGSTDYGAGGFVRSLGCELAELKKRVAAMARDHAAMEAMRTAEVESVRIVGYDERNQPQFCAQVDGVTYRSYSDPAEAVPAAAREGR